MWPIGASRRGRETSCRGEVLWPVGLHIEVRCYDLDEQVEDITEDVELFAAIGTKVKPRLWGKKHESQACDRDKLKLKAVVLHDGHEEVHMT